MTDLEYTVQLDSMGFEVCCTNNILQFKKSNDVTEISITMYETYVHICEENIAYAVLVSSEIYTYEQFEANIFY